MVRILVTTFVIALGLWTRTASAAPEDEIAGRVIGQAGDTQIELPLLRSDFKIDIRGDVATVQLTQEFLNPSEVPMSAEYLFPLNQSAAVYAMEMVVGDERISAVIQEKAEAEATFKAAEAEGKAAALLTQHRPNMFTQRVANLMPGLPITVTLSYVQNVPKVDEAYELVVPLVVGPRYEGAQEADVLAPQLASTQNGTWSLAPLPNYPQVAGLDVPDEIAEDRVSLALNLQAAVPLGAVFSPTHTLSLSEDGAGISASFDAGRVIDNRDLVIRYEMGSDAVTTGILTHKDERGGFLSLMIEPPMAGHDLPTIPRELVFVLDTSGSMNGAPLRASKRFMQEALKAMRPEDHFRVIRFANTADQFSTTAQPATPQNVRAGQRFVRGLSAGGGTEIDNAIRTAFATQPVPGAMRIVVFLSDGYIGGEAAVLSTIRSQIGEARIYAFGVGSAVNRYLLDAMAEEGRGYARYVDPTKGGDEAADALARELRTPLLTDIAIDWRGLEVSDVTPARIPDLFAGNSVRVYARYKNGGEGTVRITGNAGGQAATLPIALDLPQEATSTDSAALALIWAREQIADLDRAIAVQDGSFDRLKAAIIDLGLRFSLQTQFTAFVAVSQRIVNETGQSEKAQVPLAKVAGVEATAYPNAGFSGSSAPEPETMLGLLVLAALGAARFGRRRRA